jgi:putative phosphoesterase
VEDQTHTIGVISDTHGVLRPEVVDALRGCGRIIHAGDVGEESILGRLQRVAPVDAVRGNVDFEPWARRLPEKCVVEVGGVSVYVLHDILDLDLDPDAAGFDIVISGHSHRPSIEHQDGVMFLNPGSAGPRRFRLPVSMAKLHVRGGRATAEIVEVVW